MLEIIPEKLLHKWLTSSSVVYGTQHKLYRVGKVKMHTIRGIGGGSRQGKDNDLGSPVCGSMARIDGRRPRLLYSCV